MSKYTRGVDQLRTRGVKDRRGRKKLSVGSRGTRLFHTGKKNASTILIRGCSGGKVLIAGW